MRVDHRVEHTITDNVAVSTLTLTYDAINRLTNDGGNITYDSNSNELTVGGTTNTIPASNNLMHTSGGGTFLYDSAGNLTSVNGGSLQTYSKANRLATVNTSSYAYDAFGGGFEPRPPGRR